MIIITLLTSLFVFFVFVSNPLAGTFKLPDTGLGDH